MAIPDPRWTYQKRSRPKRWYLAGADTFELDFSIQATHAYPMNDEDGFDGFVVCWRGHNLNHRLIQGERIDFTVQPPTGLTVGISISMMPDFSFFHSNTLDAHPELLKSPRSHPFIFKTLAEAQMFVDSLMSIRTTYGSRRGA